jgi:hypothetical protein
MNGAGLNRAYFSWFQKADVGDCQQRGDTGSRVITGNNRLPIQWLKEHKLEIVPPVSRSLVSFEVDR